MKGYGQICPLARAAEVLGERWTILILRALLYDVQSFNSLRKSMTHISPTLLSERLKSLESSGMLERVDENDKVYYRLTEAGIALKPVLMALGEWGARFTDSNPDDADLDIGHILWELPRRMDLSVFPEEDTVCRFEIDGAAIPVFFLLANNRYAKILIRLPKYMDVTSTVRFDIGTLARIWVDERSFDEVEGSGNIEVDGNRSHWRRVKESLRLNLFAHSAASRIDLEGASSLSDFHRV